MADDMETWIEEAAQKLANAIHPKIGPLYSASNDLAALKAKAALLSAVMWERERCAGIADDQADKERCVGRPLHRKGPENVAFEIAAAIRTAETPDGK